MTVSSRRRFLQNVGSGMLVAGLGSNLALELGVAQSLELIPTEPAPYGELGVWVTRMQEMNPDKLQVKMAEEILARNVTLSQLVASAALANAQTFGGEDYVGYHAEMALLPALEMAPDLPLERQPLPVLKVIYRNSSRIQQFGPGKKLRQPITAISDSSFTGSDQFGPELRRLVRDADMNKAEELFATALTRDKKVAFDTLLYTIADEIDVHRFVLAYRGMGLIDVAGEEHAQTLLRQCVRHCVDFETRRKQKGEMASPIREHLPKLLDEFQLVGKPLGTREPDDAWLDEFSRAIYDSSKFEASRAAAAALAEGISPKSICQAISLAANQLTLRQSGNPLRTHGASAGVHGADAAHAWRHMIGNANDLNAKVGLLVSAWHTGQYEPWATDPYPLENHFEKVKSNDAKDLLGLCEEAIRGNDQATASAAVHRYGVQGFDAKPVFDLMMKYAISEDGRLHSEKFYRTTVEEFGFCREPYRWRYLVALARVTASAFAYDVNDNHGVRAPGYVDACGLLKVSV